MLSLSFSGDIFNKYFFEVVGVQFAQSITESKTFAFCALGLEAGCIWARIGPFFEDRQGAL